MFNLVIDYFIENLTGIKNSQVKNAPKLEEVLLHMINWLGERDYKIYRIEISCYMKLKQKT